MSDKLLEVKNLSVEYDTEISTVYAVNGLDLDLNYGETLGLVGETGAGKTTTALSVIQLLPEGIGFVTDGSIKLDGVDMLNAPEEKIRAMRGSVVSMIFQDPMICPEPGDDRGSPDHGGAEDPSSGAEHGPTGSPCG